MNLLVDAGHAREDGRPHGGQRLPDPVGVRAKRGRVPRVRTGEVHQSSEVVREREVEEHDVAPHDEPVEAVDHGDHRVVVAMADHAGLRRAGRPRGVDVREEVVLADPGLGLGERPRLRGPEFTSAIGQGVEIGEGEHVPEARQPVAHLRDLCGLLLVLDQDAYGLGVPEDVGAVVRGGVRVDGGGDRAYEGEREVEERPLEARRAEDSDRVALADAERQQSVRQLLHPTRRIRPRHPVPDSVLLDQVGRIGMLCGHGVAPQPPDRPRLLLHGRSVRGKGHGCGGRKPVAPD